MNILFLSIVSHWGHSFRQGSFPIFMDGGNVHIAFRGSCSLFPSYTRGILNGVPKKDLSDRDSTFSAFFHKRRAIGSFKWERDRPMWGRTVKLLLSGPENLYDPMQ